MTFQAHPLILAEHFPMLRQWWEERQFPAPDPMLLPPTGVLITHGLTPVAAGFLFKTDAKIATIGHLVSDPRSDRGIRSEATDYLIFSLLDHARQEGFRAVTGATNLPRLMQRYELLGFVKTDEGISHFGRIF